MRLLAPLGLLVALGIIGPIIAHLLRRRRPVEHAFAATRLVPVAPMVARRRAHLDDRALFSLRALAVLGLALLAASPLVRCNTLALDRKGGASIALVLILDDSMSMHALLATSAQHGAVHTRWDRAVEAAREILGSLRSGDSVAIVGAGNPARVLLAPTTDANLAKGSLEALAMRGAEDRATDLDGALTLAEAALTELPQPDRRVVVLSDLADERAKKLSISAELRAELSAPLAELRQPPPTGLANCAVISAGLDPADGAATVRAKVRCVGVTARDENLRSVALVVDGKTLASVPLADSNNTTDVILAVADANVPGLAPRDGLPRAFVRLMGPPDGLARDDQTPVLGASDLPIVGVVVGEGGALDEIVATGGASLLERALGSLKASVTIRPLPGLPETESELAPLAALCVDDPAGLGPEARVALANWVDAGGLGLVALGPRAASPPLGAGFEPLLLRTLKWTRVDGPLGVDPNKPGPFGLGVDPPADLAPKGRTLFDSEDLRTVTIRAAFGNQTPLLVTATRGLGEVWFSSLPFSPEVSDLPLRPAFLALLDSFLDQVRDRASRARITVGSAWTMPLSASVVVTPIASESSAPLPVETDGQEQRVRPRKIGGYQVTVSSAAGKTRKDLRVVVVDELEVSLVSRTLDPSAGTKGSGVGLAHAAIELGPHLGIGLIGLLTIEFLIRLRRLGSRTAGTDVPHV